MKKNRQNKIMTIVTLCVAVVGLTLGFAAFSNTLTISSSATVTPDASDFKIKIYGMPETQDWEDFDFENPQSWSLDKFSSSTAIAPLLEVGFQQYPATATIGKIDNDNLMIDNLVAQFTGPDHYIEYVFVIKNEGKYDAYYSLLDFNIPSHTCTAGEGTTEALVVEACKGIGFNLQVGYLNKTTDTIDWHMEKIMDQNGNIKLAPGEFWVARIIMRYEYGSARADGPFDVKWDDFNFNFKTNAS